MADFNKSYLELLLCLTAQKLVKLKGGKQKIKRKKEKCFSLLGEINLGESESGDVHGLRFPGFKENWAGTTKNGLGDAFRICEDILENMYR